MTIDLEQETEAELIRKAEEEGKRPEEYAAELLRSSLGPVANAAHSDENGWLRGSDGTLLGFDGMTWKQIAHLDHKY